MALGAWIIGVTIAVTLIAIRTHELSSDLRQRRNQEYAEDMRYWYPELHLF
ncbi:MAG TPA: hypothetical protein VHV57_18790 [Acidimicrobiales bacterium]|jgi:hypothetical protein|nr:hypothetical protein [Acidimicrobiales bacterium]